MSKKADTYRYTEWLQTYRTLMPDAQAFYASLVEWERTEGSAWEAERVRALWGVHARLPEHEKAEADAAVRRTK